MFTGYIVLYRDVPVCTLHIVRTVMQSDTWLAIILDSHSYPYHSFLLSFSTNYSYFFFLVLSLLMFLFRLLLTLKIAPYIQFHNTNPDPPLPPSDPRTLTLTLTLFGGSKRNLVGQNWSFIIKLTKKNYLRKNLSNKFKNNYLKKKRKLFHVSNFISKFWIDCENNFHEKVEKVWWN